LHASLADVDANALAHVEESLGESLGKASKLKQQNERSFHPQSVKISHFFRCRKFLFRKYFLVRLHKFKIVQTASHNLRRSIRGASPTTAAWDGHRQSREVNEKYFVNTPRRQGNTGKPFVFTRSVVSSLPLWKTASAFNTTKAC